MRVLGAELPGCGEPGHAERHTESRQCSRHTRKWPRSLRLLHPPEPSHACPVCPQARAPSSAQHSPEPHMALPGDPSSPTRPRSKGMRVLLVNPLPMSLPLQKPGRETDSPWSCQSQLSCTTTWALTPEDQRGTVPRLPSSGVPTLEASVTAAVGTELTPVSSHQGQQEHHSPGPRPFPCPATSRRERAPAAAGTVTSHRPLRWQLSSPWPQCPLCKASGTAPCHPAAGVRNEAHSVGRGQPTRRHAHSV